MSNLAPIVTKKYYLALNIRTETLISFVRVRSDEPRSAPFYAWRSLKYYD